MKLSKIADEADLDLAMYKMGRSMIGLPSKG
jgi:hypothetical protein